MVSEVQKITTTVYTNEQVQNGSGTTTPVNSVMDEAGVTAGVVHTPVVSSNNNESEIDFNTIYKILQVLPENKLEEIAGRSFKSKSEYINFIIGAINEGNEELANKVLSAINKDEAKISYAKQRFLAYNIENLTNEEKELIFNTVILPELKNDTDCDIEELSEIIKLIIESVGKEQFLSNAKTSQAYLYTYKNIANGDSIEDISKNGLYATLGINPGEDSEVVVDKLKNYIDQLIRERCCEGSQYNAQWIGELSRIAMNSNAEERKIIYNMINKYQAEIENMGEGNDTLRDIINVVRKTCESKQEEITVTNYISKDSATLPKAVVEDIANEFKEGGLLYNVLSSEDKAKFEALKAKVDNGEVLSEDEAAFFEECKNLLAQAREIAENVTTGISTRIGKDYTKEEASSTFETINKGVSTYGEDTYREYLDNVSKWIAENKDKLENISAEELQSLINEVSEKVLEDGSYNAGADSTSSTESTSVTGGFGYQSVSEAELAAQVQRVLSLKIETPSEDTPVLVKNNASFDNAVLVNGNNVDWINEQIKKDGIVGFTRNVLNSRNARGSNAFDRGLAFLERCVGGFKQVMYSSIHNTTNACIALRESFTEEERQNVTAQNIYVAQQLEKMQKA